MSEKASGVHSVRKEIAIVAGPMGWDDTRESWLSRVPGRVRRVLKTEKETVSFRIVKSLFYGEIDDPDHWAARDIRRAAQLIKARNEASALADQYEAIAGGLNATDPDFYSQDVAALVHAARILRGLDRS